MSILEIPTLHYLPSSRTVIYQRISEMFSGSFLKFWEYLGGSMLVPEVPRLLVVLKLNDYKGRNTLKLKTMSSLSLVM